MNPASSRQRRLAVAAVAAAAAAAAAIAIQRGRPTAVEDPAPATVVSADVAALFYKSLAALDVDENELAAGSLEQAVRQEQEEPALWANLAVARMRLQETEAAGDALQRALSLAADSYPLAALQAELFEQAGQIELAIEQLRELHRRRPEDLKASFSLATLLGQLRSDAAQQEQLQALSDLLDHAPDNLRAQCQYARLAATQRDGQALRTALDRLLAAADSWAEDARTQLTEADRQAKAEDFLAAARSLTFAENLLKRSTQYQQALAHLGVSSAAAVGRPLRQLLRRRLPTVEAAEADTALTFRLQPPFEAAARPDLVLALEEAGERRSTLLSLSGDDLRAGETAALPFPGSSKQASPTSIAAADLNFDFVQDLAVVGAEGCRIFLRQEDGAFAEADADVPQLASPWRGVWSVDVEADGDLDLLLSDHQSPLRWLRNNGDMTFTWIAKFIGAANCRELAAADLDGDGDVDLATLDTAGEVAVWENKRGGGYAAKPPLFGEPRVALAVGDVDRDGRFDLLSLTPAGGVHAVTWTDDGAWSDALVLESSRGAGEEIPLGQAFLDVADIDNNGAADLIASGRHEAFIWLSDATGRWVPLRDPPPLSVTTIADIDGDGLLDLAGTTADGGRLAINGSRQGYGWHVLQTLANTAAGDKRINPFGVGGRIELRAGRLAQAAVIRSPQTHFGLGRHSAADVARVVWPNGTVQAEFDLQANQSVAARQRLKGSCPWVFAFDGQEFRFVKDFIWRSPLGLRINAQDTAGVAQTEDWIKIPGRQLAPVDGRLLLRITAELWETHFFDYVLLLAVDHPADVEVLVDERFVPAASQSQRVLAVSPPRPLSGVVDHRGEPLDAALAAADGVYADGFALGEYQGVAEEHWIEFDLPPDLEAGRDVLLVGNGWVYPTDSSINVAIAQGGAPRPHGLLLEQRLADGRWRTVRDNLGFPAGKNKDAVIAVPAEALAGPRHFRLRTNMEVYWDSLAWSCARPDVAPRVTRLTAAGAELRRRGYSRMLPLHRRRPDTPVYEVASAGQPWLDLEGYYTRYGEVGELLAEIDDRYVIMNAGDELALEFPAVDVPRSWRRSYVLVGDGWVKDGDFNTAFSRWVRPLPAHGDPAYRGPLSPLERDPVFLRHREDWRAYHTRYVTPKRFQQGLWPAAGPALGGD